MGFIGCYTHTLYLVILKDRYRNGVIAEGLVDYVFC